MGEGRGEGKTTAPISDDPQTQGRLKSSANPNLISGNRLKEYNGIEYTYDALGNLIYRQLPNGENQYYQYDLENQLVRAEIKKPAGNTEIWTYAYDPFGRRLSKERQDKLAWTSTDPKRIHFVWDGTRLLQEYTYKGSYTYIYIDQDSYEPLAQVFDNAKDGKQYLAYFHTDQIGIPKEMTDIHGNLLWYGEYTAWGRLKKDERVYRNAHQPFRLQNQYYDEETGLHYNLMRYYEPEVGRFVNQDPIGLWGGDNLYQFAPNAAMWLDPWGLAKFGSGKGTHNAIVSHFDSKGNLVGQPRSYQSGGMTPEEKALGFPRSTLATHTENRAMRDLTPDLKPGDTVRIKGEYPACPSCKGAMNRAHEKTGARIIYEAPGTEPWEAGKSKKRTRKAPRPAGKKRQTPPPGKC